MQKSLLWNEQVLDVRNDDDDDDNYDFDINNRNRHVVAEGKDGEDKPSCDRRTDRRRCHHVSR